MTPSLLIEGTPTPFLPDDVDQFFGLQLALRLGATDRVRRYAKLASRHPRELLLSAFRRAMRRRAKVLSDAFDQELQHLINTCS